MSTRARGLLALLCASCCRVGAAHGPLAPADLEAARRDGVELAGAGFSSAVVDPFALLVEGAPRDRDEAVAVVSWAQRGLRASLFDSGPGSVLTIWVFADEERYMRGSSALLGLVPATPYGFYSPCSRVLVVNGALGWGTLVHEMVHAYVHADFPDAPVWLNEGLASLYEAPADDPSRPGALRGQVNWRLPALQRALAAGRAPAFATLVASGRSDFSGPRGGLLYASARYLLFSLQERGLLPTFYERFRADVRSDPTGIRTLLTVTRRDLAALRTEWEREVLALRPEPR